METIREVKNTEQGSVPESVTPGIECYLNDSYYTLAEQYDRKNHDYGNSFEKSLDEFGPIAGVVRLGDKMNRLSSLVKKDSEHLVEDESLLDTVGDLATYALMLHTWMTKEKGTRYTYLHRADGKTYKVRSE
jgi:hypothetical protein